jgi:hypothetical protein
MLVDEMAVASRPVYLVGKTLAIGGHLPTRGSGWALFPLDVTIMTS